MARARTGSSTEHLASMIKRYSCQSALLINERIMSATWHYSHYMVTPTGMYDRSYAGPNRPSGTGSVKLLDTGVIVGPTEGLRELV